MDFILIQYYLLSLSFATALLALVLIVVKPIKKQGSRPKADQPLAEKTQVEQDLIKSIRQTGEQIEANMDQILHKIAADDIQSIKLSTKSFESSYADMLEGLNKELHRITSEAIQNSQKTYTDRFTSFIDQLTKTAVSTQTSVDKKTSELLTIADREIGDYRSRRMEKIDQEVKELVDKVYKDVLKTSISENMQNELIIKSLEQAKKDNLFKF